MAEAPNPTQDLLYRWHIFGDACDIVNQKFTDLNTIITDQLADTGTLLLDFTTAVNTAAEELGQIIATIDVEDLPTLTLPTFTAIAPAAITVTYNAPVLEMADTLEDAIGTKLINDITSASPAIPADVEAAIFARESERAALLYQDDLDAIANEWSKRGFTLPNAYLLAAITQAQIDYTNKRLDVSRDIAIKNFELSDTNMKFAIQQGLAYILNRIEIYKAEIQAELSRIDAEVKVYMAQVQVYQSEAQVYNIKVDAAVKEFDARYKAAMMDAELQLKVVDAEIKKVELVYGMSIESTKALGSIHSQILAGAMSGVSAGAHMQATNSASYEYSTNPSY